MRRGRSRLLIWIYAAIFLVFAWVVVLPILASWTASRPSTQCLSNLKRLATASLIYRDDWDQRMMDRDIWMDAVIPYIKSSVPGYDPSNVIHCPSVQESENNSSLYGYAFNSKLSFADSSRFKEPDKVEMLYDSVNLGRNASDPVTSLPNPPRMHVRGRRNNMAYLDSHAKALPPPKPK